MDSDPFADLIHRYRVGALDLDALGSEFERIARERGAGMAQLRQLINSLGHSGTLSTDATDRLLRRLVPAESATIVEGGGGADTAPANDATVVRPGPGEQPTRVAQRPEPPPHEATVRQTDARSSSLSGSDWSDPAAWRATHAGPIEPGVVVKDRYVVEARLGEGGMGQVFKVKDLVHEAAGDRNPHVAMKVLGEEFRKHPDSLKALHRETRKSQTLAHPNIITVYHFDRDGTTVFMTMELLDGKPLNDVIRDVKFTGLPPDEAGRIVEQMAEGLAYAHERGFVHADFKPGNVFYSADDRVKVLDFGIAQPARIAGIEPSENTQFDEHSLGAMTIGYASLEMLDHQRPVPSDDVYALGLVAHQLYTGRHPFNGRSAKEARAQNLAPEFPRDMPARPRRAIERALAFTRDQRHEDAGEFLKAFRGPRPLQRRVAVALVALAALSLALGVRWIMDDGATVAFADLPSDVQERIVALEGPADEAFQLADGMQVYRNEAVDYYLRILALHPDNETANERVDTLARQWAADARRLADDGDDPAARRLLENLFSAYPALASRDALAAIAASLDVTPPQGARD